MASKLLAAALFLEGMWVQSFPAFGVERRGAPVTAFLRVASERILLRCEVTEPNDLIVLDPTLIDAIDVTTGLKAGGSLLINSSQPPEHYGELAERFTVATVDASSIASRLGIGSKTQPIVNTALVGAFAAHSGLVRLDSVCAAIDLLAKASDPARRLACDRRHLGHASLELDQDPRQPDEDTPNNLKAQQRHDRTLSRGG